MLVHARIVLHSFLDGFGRLWQMVMRDLGEEKVVYNMAVGNVMSQGIDSKSVASINGLGLTLEIKLILKTKCKIRSSGKTEAVKI